MAMQQKVKEDMREKRRRTERHRCRILTQISLIYEVVISAPATAVKKKTTLFFMHYTFLTVTYLHQKA